MVEVSVLSTFPTREQERLCAGGGDRPLCEGKACTRTQDAVDLLTPGWMNEKASIMWLWEFPILSRILFIELKILLLYSIFPLLF